MKLFATPSCWLYSHWHLCLAPIRAVAWILPSSCIQQPILGRPTTATTPAGVSAAFQTKINDRNVKSLSLAWMYQLSSSGDPSGGRISATPLVVNGIMYFTVPDKVWAVDARTGHEVWTYTWTSKGGIHLGNRGVGISGNSPFFETPDCNLVSLNLKDGKKLWNQEICDLDQMYYASVAPVVVKNHVITGVSGDDLDRPGYLEARDPETGETPMALVRGSEAGRAGFGNLAERRCNGAWRRDDVDLFNV